eukprot:TRINITY_DN11885_c0_g1_i1.p1 TRINITY_DN11885_c0_g1~~TRINITY_DN11885_c0_g1_i1.p1  ORF type:complete len:209 (-),score=49.36 TRINITY_DN11885_c0_g1_i1:103-645(-)
MASHTVGKVCQIIAVIVVTIAVVLAFMSLATHDWKVYDSYDGSEHVGLLRRIECLAHETCHKLHLLDKFGGFLRPGRVAFVFILLGTVSLLLSIFYLLVNLLGKRMENRVLHYVLSTLSLLGGVSIAFGWIVYALAAPKMNNYHMGYSFSVAVLASVLAVIGFCCALFLRESETTSYETV